MTLKHVEGKIIDLTDTPRILPESELEKTVKKSNRDIVSFLGKEVAIFTGLIHFPTTYLGTLLHENIHHIPAKFFGAISIVDMEKSMTHNWWPTDIQGYNLFAGITALAPSIVSGIMSWYLLKPLIELPKKQKNRDKIFDNIIKDYNAGNITPKQAENIYYNTGVDFMLEFCKSVTRGASSLYYNPLVISLTKLDKIPVTDPVTNVVTYVIEDSDFSIAAKNLGDYFAQYVPQITEFWFNMSQQEQILTLGTATLAISYGLYKTGGKITNIAKKTVNYIKEKIKGYPTPVPLLESPGETENL